MSLTMILVPMAVAITVCSAETILAVKTKCSNWTNQKSEKIETKFADANLLHETLLEHGIPVTVHDENSIEANFPMGKIIYSRSSCDENYKMQIVDVCDVDGLICNLDMLENEYNLNVQSYTYNRVISNIPDNMSIESEEVLEDDSILITITIE